MSRAFVRKVANLEVLEGTEASMLHALMREARQLLRQQADEWDDALDGDESDDELDSDDELESDSDGELPVIQIGEERPFNLSPRSRREVFGDYDESDDYVVGPPGGKAPPATPIGGWPDDEDDTHVGPP